VIQVDILLDRQGGLKGFSVKGHSGTGKPGTDLVCAAVTVLFRTAARLVHLQPDIRVQGDASRSGTLEMEITSVSAGKQQWLAGLSDFLIRGAEDLQEEHPQAISVRIREGED
jgi:hypothetical protein